MTSTGSCQIHYIPMTRINVTLDAGLSQLPASAHAYQIFTLDGDQGELQLPGNIAFGIVGLHHLPANTSNIVCIEGPISTYVVPDLVNKVSRAQEPL